MNLDQREALDRTERLEALLVEAAVAGNASGVAALLAAGAPITASDGMGNGIFHLMPQDSRGDEAARAAVDFAVANKIGGLAASHSPDVWSGGTPLHAAAAAGNPRRLTSLLRLNGAALALPLTDAKGRTALHHAARDGEGECVEILLRVMSRSPSPILEERDDLGRTPLFVAAQQGNQEAVSLLLAAGANHSALTFKGEHPLHAVFSFETMAKSRRLDAMQCAERILEAGAFAGVVDAQGDTPLHRAAASDSALYVRRLSELTSGSLTGSRNRAGETPLHVAARHGSYWATDALRKDAPDTEARDLEGRTPLMLAAATGHEDTCAALVALGADPEAVGPLGTARDMAKASGRFDAAVAIDSAARGEWLWKNILARDREERLAQAKEDQRFNDRSSSRSSRRWDLQEGLKVVGMEARTI
jgi:ankyrin repeat protein